MVCYPIKPDQDSGDGEKSSVEGNEEESGESHNVSYNFKVYKALSHIIKGEPRNGWSGEGWYG